MIDIGIAGLDTSHAKAFSEMEPIEGSAPDPVNVPSGCSYHPRCPLADETCRSTDPESHKVSDSHQASCFHWQNSQEEIPLVLEGSGESSSISGKQSADPVVSLENVDVHFEESGGLLDIFRDPDIVRAVDDVSLDIYENDVVALVGESGCGKTTLGKAAIAAEKPTGGSIYYRDQDIWEAKENPRQADIPFMEIRRSLQMIHQDPGASLNPNRTVMSTLTEPLKKWDPDMDKDNRRSEVLNMLETVGMSPPDDYAYRYPHQLSGGEKQRVALVRILVMSSDLILADEAVSALDVSLRVEMMDLLLDLQNRFDTSILFISHNLSNARYLAGKTNGRIGVMYIGEIVEIGPAQEIINKTQNPYTKVLVWSTADLNSNQENKEPPVRGIDIPDPINPPSGCRFHTRYPEAREACRKSNPTLEEGRTKDHSTACFREYGEDHAYWNSDSIVDEKSVDGLTD